MSIDPFTSAVVGAIDPFQVARFKLSADKRYLDTLLWSMVPIPTPGLGTMGVDQYLRVQYDPELGSKWNVEELTGVLYHECWHWLQDHFIRGEGLDPFKANIAGDLEINDHIDVTLPKEAIKPSTFKLPDGKIMEWYYSKLPDPQIIKVPMRGPSAGQCGSVANGTPGEHELPAPGQKDAQGNVGPRGVGKHQAEVLKDQVAKDIQGRGDAPGFAQEWAGKRLDRKIPWGIILSSTLRNAVAYTRGQDDYSYMRPARRMVNGSARHIILPGMVKPLPKVTILVDTSGSMSPETLGEALGLIDGVLKATGTAAHLIQYDAQKQDVNKRLTSVSKITQWKGRGGTDMAGGIIEAQKTNPDVTIVLTDGQTPWPGTKPRSKVIVVLIGPYAARSAAQVPEWAKTVVAA